MKWTILLLISLMLVTVYALRAAPALSSDKAEEKLKQGAVVIDVRTVGEYQAGHLTNTVNLPLDKLRESITNRFPDRTQALLLHCRTGRRSQTAERELRSLGYTNAFNIGSYKQAEKVVDSSAKP